MTTVEHGLMKENRKQSSEMSIPEKKQNHADYRTTDCVTTEWEQTNMGYAERHGWCGFFAEYKTLDANDDDDDNGLNDDLSYTTYIIHIRGMVHVSTHTHTNKSTHTKGVTLNERKAKKKKKKERRTNE